MATTEQLRATLRELESELESIDTLDEETRTMLENAAREIHETLQSKEKRASDSESTVSTLREAIERFEASHPTLTGILRRLVDTLAQMGI